MDRIMPNNILSIRPNHPHSGTFVSILYELTRWHAATGPGGRNSGCWPATTLQHGFALSHSTAHGCARLPLVLTFHS